MFDIHNEFQKSVVGWHVYALKGVIILWAVVIIILAITIDNPWALSGILAWEVLP